MPEDTIDSLRAQLASVIREKDAEISRLTRESMRRKDQNRKLAARLEGREAQPKHGSPKGNGEANGEADPEVDQLRAENRALKHSSGLGELAYSEEVGINRKVPVSRIMQIMGYKPTADTFDVKAVKKALLDLKESDSYLFEGDQGTTPPKSGHGSGSLAPGVAAMGSALGRGASPSSIDNQAPSEAEMRDPVFITEYNRKQRAATGK